MDECTAQVEQTLKDLAFETLEIQDKAISQLSSTREKMFGVAESKAPDLSNAGTPTGASPALETLLSRIRKQAIEIERKSTDILVRI